VAQASRPWLPRSLRRRSPPRATSSPVTSVTESACGHRRQEMAVETTTLPQIKGVKDVPYDELFVSGHRTCQGCESALVMRHMVKASGPRTIVLGSTGCMYVANTTYY